MSHTLDESTHQTNVSHTWWKHMPVVWRFRIISKVPSRLSTGFQHLSQDLTKTSRANECLWKNMFIFFSSRIKYLTALCCYLRGSKVHSCDWNVSKQRARNVPLASADTRGGGRLCDKPKEYLHRRLCTYLFAYKLIFALRSRNPKPVALRIC